jgi:dynein heavy chain
LALTFSPVGEVFRKRLRTFPSLINCTTIDWFLPWPKTALDSVAKNFLSKTEIELGLSTKISKIFVKMHADVTKMSKRFVQEYKKYFYVTPKTYLELIECFIRSLGTNTEKNQNDTERYDSGLQKLDSAEKEVEEKNEELILLQPELKKASKETDALIVRVQEEQVIADVKKSEAEEEEAKCNVTRDQANLLKQDCQKEVDKLEPILVAALKNLEGVTKDHIVFIKSTKIPSAAYLLLFKSLCYVYGYREGKEIKMVKDPNNQFKKIPDYFDCCRKKIMNKPNTMLENLKSYDEDKINSMSETIINKIKHMRDTEAFFNNESLSKASEAAGMIYNWMMCVIEVYEKLQLINPKRAALAEAEEKLAAAEAVLQKTKDNLQKIIDKIDALNQQLKEAQEKKINLENRVKLCKKQLKNAVELMSGLANEKESWAVKRTELKEASKTILGDTLLSAGIIAYLGAFPKDYREELIEEWKVLIGEKYEILLNKDYSLKQTCSDELTIGNWVDKYSLPNDSISIDNAIILNQSSRYPLIIDPQVQANRWLKKLYKSKNLYVLKPSDESNRIINVMVEAIQTGLPILIENVGEQLGTMFESILEQKTKIEVGKKMMKFMDKFYEYDPNFSFFMTTKLANPHYPPEICAQVTLLNFQVTPEGLEDQMINKVVVKEHSSMANKWQSLIKKFYELKKRTKENEDQILSLLKNQSGNILDDDELIETLKLSKKSTDEANMGLKDIELNRAKMKKLSEMYKECGYRASNLFFCVTDMASVEPMYQFSLDWFMELFEKAIAADPKNKETRTNSLICCSNKFRDP